jgi:Pyruvate/2-oxoacid:ferredoxin oxidoreductase delta subunit
MGHLVGKDLYRALGRKIDGLTTRAPWNDTLYAILKNLYTAEEAEVIIKMPYGLGTLDQIERNTGLERARLQNILENLAAKGLVMDLYFNNKYHYMISPYVIGIFEFTMMRTGGNVDFKEMSRLFRDYFEDGEFHRVNCDDSKQLSPLRALPYEGTLGDHVEIMDYEKASAIIDNNKKFAVGICSCRHEKEHLGLKKCDSPMETCTTMGMASDYMIKHGFAREISKTEMLEIVTRSRELGLVICADDIKNDIGFFCHCCGCCCNVLEGVSKRGYSHAVVTSNYIAKCNSDECLKCGDCATACPVKAIKQEADSYPTIDQKFCIGCGVCAVKCPSDAMKLTARAKRTLLPEDTFERIILQCLERGTLQNQIFSDPTKISHTFMRGLLGGFLRLPPVKKALMSDSLRSSFLSTMRKGAM